MSSKKSAVKITHFLGRYFKPIATEVVFRGRNTKPIYISMKHLLLQGARPCDLDIQAAHNGFQGGYLCTLVINEQPAKGMVAVGWDHMGFEYTPLSPVFSGHDTFSYSVLSPLGQVSDANCVHVFVGV